MSEKFSILMADDSDHEDLFAEIYYDDEFVAMVSQEEGFENLRISIYPPKETEHWDFRFDEFEEIIQLAKKGLWEMRSDSKDQCYPCPCCGHLTLSENTHDTFEICTVCNWEDDDVQFNNPDFPGGANEACLNEARINFKIFGTSSRKFLKGKNKCTF
jgi:hypothetical protein